jgi:hypothetical protein
VGDEAVCRGRGGREGFENRGREGFTEYPGPGSRIDEDRDIEFVGQTTKRK